MPVRKAATRSSPPTTNRLATGVDRFIGGYEATTGIAYFIKGRHHTSHPRQRPIEDPEGPGASGTSSLPRIELTTLVAVTPRITLSGWTMMR